MQQAGIEKIILYERKSLNISYNASGYIENISTGGLEIEINNDDYIRFTYSIEKSRNNQIGYLYDLTYYFYEITLLNVDYLIDIKKSIYGFSPKIWFYNGDIKFLNDALIFNSNVTHNNSNHFEINLKSRALTKEKFITFEQIEGEGIGYWFVENDFIVQ